MKPKKSDFPSFIPFNGNIEDSEINPRIDDAFKFDIRPKLEALADDIKAYNGTDRPQLKAFYENFLLHWWVLLAFKRFIELHGFNVTQFGLTKTKDPDGTFEQMSAQDRAVMLKQLQSDANTCFAMLSEELGNKKWKYDNVQYRKSSCSSPSTSYGINAIE